jgi:catechol 2,3-dioxygenase-like lactoylglutathione lyase family enzyme
MLSYERIHTTIPVVDVNRARRFYRDTLGLEEVGSLAGNGDDNVMFRVGDCSRFMLFKRPHRTKAEHTIAGLRVDDLEETMDVLEQRGVRFERYNTPDLKTDERGVARMGNWKGAWFKDSEGNILAVGEES